MVLPTFKQQVKSKATEIKGGKKKPAGPPAGLPTTQAEKKKYTPSLEDNQYAQALAAFNPGGTFVPRAAQEEIAARKAANHSRYMDALDTSTRAGVAAAGSGTVRSVMDTSETQAIKNEIAGKMAAREKDRTNAGKHFRSVRGNDDYRDRVLGFDNGALPYGRTDTARLRYALDEDYRGQIDTFNQRQGLLENPYDKLKYLTDEERRDLQYYASRGEYDRANEYLDYLAPDLNARMQGIASNEMAKLSEEQPVAGVLANIAASREAGLGVLPTIRGAVKEQMGIYEPVDTNSRGFRAAHMLRDTTEGVGNAAYNAAGGGIAGDTARFIAEAGLSAAQNASMLPMGGTAPLVFMGSMAAGQSALDTLESGGTAQDALKVAAATGIIEAATEKIGIDNFFRISRLGKKGIQQLLKEYKLGKPLVNNIKSFAGDLGTQMAAEGAEEMIAEVAENLADTAIRGDNGQYAQLVQTYMANGMSEEQAKARAFTDMYIDNVLKAGAQGAVAGGMLGVGGATIGTRYNNEVTAVGAQLAELDITPEQLISAVQQSGSKDAQDFARELSRKLVLGQEVTLADMGQLHLLSNNYITSKDYEAVQKAAIAEEEARNAGGNVRGSEQNLRGREAAAGVQQNAGNAAEAQQGESLQKPQNQSVGTQTATKAQTGAIDVASKATNNTESIEPTAGQVTGEAPSVQAPQTTENAPKEARQPTTYEQGAQVQTPQGEGTVVMTADNTVAVRLANGTTEIFKTADLSPAQANVNANTALPQAANAQTAPGNTAANARANEANAEGRSETAAQSKTVAETSWENIQKIVQTKAKGGLSQKDEYTMNSAGRRAFDRIGRALGVEIHFVDRIVNEEGEANGLYQNGHIFIARNAENPYHVVLAHEITHHFEKTAPDVYEKFKSAALKMNPGLVEKYMAMWGYDEATAEFEVAADFAGELLEKESTVKRVIKEDISAARGFHRAMNAVFDKVRGDDTKGLTEEERKFDAQLDAARDMWRRCLRETRDEKKEGGNISAEALEFSDSKTQFSLRKTAPPKKTGKAYKVFVAKNGQLYPPKVANPGGEGTPVGVWLDADVGESAPPSKTGRAQVKAGGKGTQGGSGSLAFRPGWHLGDVPHATQFARLNPETGKKELFPANFVWAECEYAADVDYQDEAMSYGYTENDKFRHSYAGLPKLPTDGYYRYRTNPKPDTVPWIITGAMKVTRILTDEETDAICRENGVEPMKRQGGVLTAAAMEEKFGIKAGETEGGESKGQFSRKWETPQGEAQRDEQEILRLREEARQLQDQLEQNEEDRVLRNRLIKVYADIDKLVAKERRLAKKTSIADILTNLENYRRSDLESLAEQVSNSAWDDYEELSDKELVEALREVLEERKDEMHPIEVRHPRYGFSVRPIEPAAPQMSRKLTPEQRKLDEDYMAAVERGDMETAQRMVDEAAKLAMPDSKAVDKNGKLLRAYHGTKEQFTAFLRDKIGSTGRFEGSGFNFTPSEGRAKNYGGNVLSVYLDISKPLNAQKKTITVPRLAQIIRQADPTGDNIIANYASSSNDYGTDRFVARESLLVARSIWGFCENDVDIYSALSVANPDAEGLIETFEKLGYDGAIHYDGYGDIKTLIAFSSNQIKSADPVTYDDNGEVIPLSERFNEKNPDMRFSMKKPVEYTKNLVALHNLSSDKFGKVLDLGGFPMPSIAVTRNDIPHTNFGDISLVMKRETIDPKANRRNTVYSADAWTPVFPQVEYEADEKKAAKLRRKYYDLEKRFGRETADALYPWGNYADDHLNRVGGEAAAIERYRDDTDMMKVFLADTKGKVPEPVTKETVTRLSDDQIKMYDHIIGELGRGAVYAIKSGDFENPLQRRKKWFEKYGDRMKAAYKSYLTELGLSDEEADNVVSQETRGSLTRHVLAARRYMENGPETKKTETDYEATREVIRKATNKKAYETWLKDMFGGIEKASGLYNYKERYTPSGNLRSFATTHYPVTLENIVKAMRSENGGNTKNVSGFHGVKTLRAGTAVRFKSVEHMHELERRLQHLTEEEAEQINNALAERLATVINEISGTRKQGRVDNAFLRMDEIGETLEEIAESGKYTLTDIRKTFEKYRYPITTEIAQDVKALLFDISEMPVNIFEAKPERVVGFDEVLAAVVPSDIDAALKQRIEDAGMRTIEYEAGSDESRLAAVNSVEGARFSRKGQDAAMRRANRLARENARLKGQFKLTRGVKLRESDIRKVTRELLKEYEIIDYDKEQFERYIKMMAEAAAQADESNADATWDSIRNVARGLSHEVGRAAFARYADVDEEYDADLVRETYEDIRRHLGRQRVLNPWFKDPWVENESPQRKEMRDYYRRKLFGVLTLTSDRSVDKGPLGDIGKLYEELTETFGEAYFPSDVTNDEDQIMHIADVLDDLKDTLTQIGERTPVTVAEDVEQSSRDETRRAAYEGEVYGEFYAALEKDILLRITEVRAEKPTFADKEKAKRDALKDKHKSRVQSLKAEIQQNRTEAQEALREAKAQKREALQELKDKYKAKTAEARERQNARELRRKIEKHTGELYKKLSKPTNEKHINEDVRPAAALLISLINQESNFETDPTTGKRVSRGGTTRKAQLAGMGLDIDLPNILTKRTEAARKMKKAAEQIFAGEDNYLLIYDPELMENLAIMEDWSDKPLTTMSSAELQVVWDAVRGVEHMITQSRKVFNEGRQWEIGTLASGLVRDVDLNNPRRTIKYGAAASVDKLLNIDQLTPQAFFHRFGEGGDRLFRMLRRSQDKYVRIIADIQARTAEVIKDIDIDKLNKDIATYKVKGGDVTLSRAQVLLLYASIKREQAAGHILGGGIKAKPLKGKGLYETKQLLPVEVTQEDLDNMFKEAKLTEAEKKAADGLVNIMSTVLAEYGNEASLRTYGYAKFREGWYVPIETDPTSNKTDNNDPLFKQFTAAASIAGRGFAKQTKEGAKNAIMVGSLFDVYAKHVNDMAMYAAYVETLENMRRVRNFKFADGTKTQNYIEALLTMSGVAYWDTLINDINGGERLKSDDFSFDRFVGAYKAAAVSANIRVILQQPTAIIRAAAEINPAYLIAAMRKIPKRHEWERIKNNVGIAQWKDWGYFDINTGRQMRDVVLGTDSLFEKFKQAGMRPMSGADSFAWTLLYHACEDEAKAKGLRPGGAAFDSFVASRFSDIIDKTQVVDGVLQRSQIMRSTNAVTKMATSFMAEPTKTYNMFLSAVWDFRHARSKTEKQAARKKLGFTVAALVVSFLTNAAAQSLIDALRDDDRDKEFLDKFWDAYLGRPEEDDKNKAVTVMGGNLWTAFNPVTYIPFFKDIVSLVQGYSTKRMDMESIGRVIDAAEQAWAASKGEGKQTAFARAMTLASEVSRVFGLPVANIKRDSVAVLNTIAQEKKDYDMMYNVDRAFYKLDKNVSRYVDIMLKAHDAGDTETEKRITDDLHAAGVDDKKIKDAADKIRQKQQNVDSVTEIKDRYRTYSEAASYNKLESYAKGTSAYRQANTTERNKYEKMLEDALANNDTAQGRHEKAREIGVSDNQYMEFLIAQDVANRQRNDGTGENEGKPGGVSKNDYIAALDMTSMTRTQKSAAFDKKYKKGNPYN